MRYLPCLYYLGAGAVHCGGVGKEESRIRDARLSPSFKTKLHINIAHVYLTGANPINPFCYHVIFEQSSILTIKHSLQHTKSE